MIETLQHLFETLGPAAYFIFLTLYNVIIFPFPNDPFMALAAAVWSNPWLVGSLTLGALALAAVIDYAGGYWLQEKVAPRLEKNKGYQKTIKALNKHGLWAVILSAVLPIPYSMVCWLCGMAKYNFKIFFLAAIISRGPRSLLVLWAVWAATGQL